MLLADGEPELMVKMIEHICPSLDELVAVAQAWADPHGEEGDKA